MNLKIALYCFLALISTIMQSQTNFDKAENYFKQSKLDLAQPLFENFLKENPNDLKSIEYLGDIHGKLEHWDKAIFYYKKLKLLSPNEANYQFKYGGVLGMKAKNANKFAALSMIKDVKTSFENAIKLNPKHIEARYALIELYLQLPAIVGGSERKARKYSDELYQISLIDGYLSKGRIEEYLENFDKAEIQLKKAHEMGNSKITYLKLYDLYQNKLKDYKKALNFKKEFEK
jgi:tetratricopeptide (TPR) repeat protein